MPMDSPKGQAVYDKVVQTAGCSDAEDSLNCLRELDYTDFLNAVTSVPGIMSYSGLALSYLPRPDGKVLTDSPEVLGMTGKIAKVPMIIGDQEDEGTLFSMSQANMTTRSGLVEYLKDYFFSEATETQIQELVHTYGDDEISAVIEGSPLGTGLLNEIFPGFKRRAALMGDLVFTLTRRVFLAIAKDCYPDTPTWSYLSSYDTGTPILGTFHGSDIVQVFYGIFDNYAAQSIRSYYLNFVYALDPNDNLDEKYPAWPKWADGEQLMHFMANKADLLADDFRQDTYEWMGKNIESLRY